MRRLCVPFLTDFTQHDHLKGASMLRERHSFILFHGCVVLRWPPFTHPPFIFSVHPSVDGHLLACLGRCEECCCEHGGVGIFSSLILSGCVSSSGAPGPSRTRPGCSFSEGPLLCFHSGCAVYIPHIFFILLVVDGRLECSHVLTVVNVLL